MKRKLFLILFFIVIFSPRPALSSINVAAHNFAKMKLALVVIGNDSILSECAEILKKDFSFSEQFDVSIESSLSLPSKKMFDTWRKQGMLLVVFLNESKNKDGFEWRIYDTNKMTMLKGKKYKKRGELLRGWAHNIADMIWPELMGQESCFSTKIAYSKEIKSEGKRNRLHIYIADYDGRNEEPLVSTPTINVAPRWNADLNNPLVFYSESSKANISLRVVDMKGRRKTASNFDGLNMLPSFSKGGKKVVYCMSHGGGHCNLYSYEKGQLQQLTCNLGNNISPTASGDGEVVYFCSDYKNGVPLIYRYNCVHGAIEQLTDRGPCFSPSYCEKTQKLAYVKRVGGVMQICIFNVKTEEHQQFTFDKNFHKEECVWSPCGNYLLFCITNQNSSRLVMEHVNTRKRRFLTSSAQQCSYPSWSPIYNEFPAIWAKKST